MDIWGPYKVATIHGHHYFLTILDDHNRAVWVYLMKAKSEVRSLIIQFCNLVENQFGTTVKCIRSDNGLEFNLQDYFSQKGIIHQTSCIYTPQQNSRVERKHGHLLSTARSLRFQANLPEQFWGECVLHAAYIINRLPSAAIDNHIPYQILIKKAPQYGHLRVFGCLAYATTVGPKSKLDARAKKCIFLGYTNGTKGYKVYDLITKELFVSRDVAFYEHVFPLQQDKISQFQNQDNSRGEHTPLRNGSFEQPSELHSPNQASSSDEAYPSLSEVPEQPPDVTSSNSSLPHATRKSTTQKHPPNYLHVCQNTTVRTSPHSISTVLNYSRLTPSF
nr:uncharacterized protein LOC109182622 [Ipomoea trifida]